jgi:hypothetical protein
MKPSIAGLCAELSRLDFARNPRVRGSTKNCLTCFPPAAELEREARLSGHRWRFFIEQPATASMIGECVLLKSGLRRPASYGISAFWAGPWGAGGKNDAGESIVWLNCPEVVKWSARLEMYQ